MIDLFLGLGILCIGASIGAFAMGLIAGGHVPEERPISRLTLARAFRNVGLWPEYDTWKDLYANYSEYINKIADEYNRLRKDPR